MVQRWTRRGEEPTVADLMKDPLTHTLMRRDGISLHELWGVVEEARRHLVEQRNAAFYHRDSRLPDVWFQACGGAAPAAQNRQGAGYEHG